MPGEGEMGGAQQLFRRIGKADEADDGPVPPTL